MQFLDTFKKATAEALEKIKAEMSIRGTKEIFLLFSLGSQFDHLIKQALEKLGVFCLVADPVSVTSEDVFKLAPFGIILSGGPVSADDSLPFDRTIFDLEIPVLGICLGFQLWAHYLGETVKPSPEKEFGVHELKLRLAHNLLFEGIPAISSVLQSHGDVITNDKCLIKPIGSTENTAVAAGYYKYLWGVQFHPEVTETKYGQEIFANFCFRICQAKDRFPAEKIAEQKIAQLAQQIGPKDTVLLALSGGSDSSTAAYLLAEALAKAGNCKAVRALYIKGIDRPDDEEYVKKFFDRKAWIKLHIEDATDKFLEVLKEQFTMPLKRVAMRTVYRGVIENYAKQIHASYIVQGTLYTDISESGSGYDSKVTKAQIKLHHNVNLNFSLPEICPLNDCVKDTGRNIGRAIGVPEELLTRHPFPGPGLVVRIEGEVTREKLLAARLADQIYIEELRKYNLYQTVWQAGVVITESVHTCTKGDGAVSGVVVTLWAVWSVNGFTAQSAELPWEFLKHVSKRLTNEIPSIGAVTYRTSGKPPTTIEWG